MKIRITFTFDEFDRRAIARHHGKEEPAGREEIESFIIGTIEGMMVDIREDQYKAEEEAEDPSVAGEQEA